MSNSSDTKGFPFSEALRMGRARMRQRIEVGEFRNAVAELREVAPDTADIVEGWAKLWRPADAV